MKQLQLGTSDIFAPSIGLGCMRMQEKSTQEAADIIDNAMNLGINFFDHADVYGNGQSEQTFADALQLKPSLREDMILQTKCGIRDGLFDFSKEHIISSVEGSLKRLNTDYIDSLLLHRPDALMEPEEVAEAFIQLKKEGKVRYFGVSNQNPMQMELLQKYVPDALIVNQLQLSIMHTPMIDAGLNVNMQNDPAIVRENSILEYCRLNNVTIQAWSPFQHGMIEGPFVGNDDFPQVNNKLQELAEAKGVTDSAIAVAWILRHPARIQTIVGTMNTKRLQDIAEADNISLTKSEWYELYRAAGNELP